MKKVLVLTACILSGLMAASVDGGKKMILKFKEL
jgi:hypothetical protein